MKNILLAFVAALGFVACVAADTEQSEAVADLSVADEDCSTGNLTAEGADEWYCGLPMKCQYKGECFECCKDTGGWWTCSLLCSGGAEGSVRTPECQAARRIQYANKNPIPDDPYAD